MTRRFCACIFIFFCAPALAAAQVVITEIMYDVEGSDTGREWIEVKNEGGGAVTLTEYKLFEEGVNHKITEFQGGAALPAGAFAVIADDPTKFLADWPGFSGLLSGSSFSLKQTGELGELLEIRSADLATVDSLTYDPTIGAGGDGNTLQKIGSQWRAAPPTPGAPSAGSGESGTTSPAGGSSPPAETPASGTGAGNTSAGSAPVTPQFSVRMRVERTLTAGADAVFSGEGYGADGNVLDRARYLWNFGDGATAEGMSVLHAYAHPGEYITVLSVASGYMSATARERVSALPAAVAVAEVKTGTDGFVSLRSGDTRDINLSRWRVVAGHDVFTFPENTFIAPGQTLTLPHAITGLRAVSAGAVSLHYPNGTQVVFLDPASLSALGAPALSAAARSEPVSSPIMPPVRPASAPQRSADASVETEEASVPLHTDIAAAAPAGELLKGARGGSVVPWLFAVAAIIGIAMAGIIARPHWSEDADGPVPILTKGLSARDFEIIDENALPK